MTPAMTLIDLAHAEPVLQEAWVTGTIFEASNHKGTRDA